MAPRDDIIRLARKYRLDPAAVLAVARGEGGLANRADDVGDKSGGGSYGPFQLYTQGALPAAFKGRPKQADAWAWSPAGIEYAVRKMAEAGAAGLTGEAAVDTIVRKFERPADPDGSAAKAIARLPSVNVGASTVAGNGAETGRPQIPAQTMTTLNQIFKKVGLPTLEGIGETQIGRPQQTPMPTIKSAAPGKATPMPKVQRMVGLIEYAQQMGLSVRENPYTDKVDPVHVKGSQHYQSIGEYQGKKVGRAIDVSGSPEKMQAFFKYAEQFSGMGLDDLFYDPMGYSYDQGKRWDKTIGGHGDHVHLSVR